MVSGAQIRMARAAAKLGVRDLAAMARVSPNTITRAEADGALNPSTFAAIRRALEAAGVEFLPDNGVRLKAKPGGPSGSSTPGTAQKPASAKTAAPRAKKPTASDRQTSPPSSKEAQIRALREQGA
jgi:transcriptional regulator with XRE-family HTH domain